MPSARPRIGESVRRIIRYLELHGPMPAARVVDALCPFSNRGHWFRRIRAAVERGLLVQLRPPHHGRENGGRVVDANT